MTEQVIASQEVPEQTGAAAETPAADAAGQPTQPEQTPNGQATSEAGTPPPDKQRNDGNAIYRYKTQRDKARERAQRLEAENAELKARITPQSPAGPPDPLQFTDYNEYVRQTASYEARREAQALIQAQQQATAQAQARAAQARLEAEFEAKADKARAAYADFDEAAAYLDEVGALEQLKPVLHHAGENAADILYYLGKHPQELDRIAALSSVEQVRAVWALADKAKPQPKQTQAPKPIEPVKSTGVSDGGYRKDMSDEDFDRWRAKRKGRTT